MSELDLDQLEDVIKLAVKYQLDEITLPDGTKIIKKLHPVKQISNRKKDVIEPPINRGWQDELLYAASGPPKVKLSPNGGYLFVNAPVKK